MLRSLLLGVSIAVLSLVAACTGDAGGAGSGPQEPVKADDQSPSIPDVPGGNSGEAQEKPAGTGQAASSEAKAVPPATEKSQPDPDAAKRAAESSKDRSMPKPVAEARAPVAIKPGEASVKTEMLNVRSGAGMKSPVTKTLKKGEKVSVKECKGSWCQIGENEYVGGRFLTQ